MMGESEDDYSRKPAVVIRDHGGQAIQCCVHSWNQLCPQYPLTNTTEVMHRKRWLFSGSDVVIFEQNGLRG